MVGSFGHCFGSYFGFGRYGWGTVLVAVFAAVVFVSWCYGWIIPAPVLSEV